MDQKNSLFSLIVTVGFISNGFAAETWTIGLNKKLFDEPVKKVLCSMIVQSARSSPAHTKDVEAWDYHLVWGKFQGDLSHFASAVELFQNAGPIHWRFSRNQSGALLFKSFALTEMGLEVTPTPLSDRDIIRIPFKAIRTYLRTSFDKDSIRHTLGSDDWSFVALEPYRIDQRMFSLSLKGLEVEELTQPQWLNLDASLRERILAIDLEREVWNLPYDYGPYYENKFMSPIKSRIEERSIRRIKDPSSGTVLGYIFRFTELTTNSDYPLEEPQRVTYELRFNPEGERVNRRVRVIKRSGAD